MNPSEVESQLTAAAQEQVDKKDLSGLAKFLDEDIPQTELSEWAKQKFGLELKVEELKQHDAETADQRSWRRRVRRISGVRSRTPSNLRWR